MIALGFSDKCRIRLYVWGGGHDYWREEEDQMITGEKKIRERERERER